MGIFSSRQKSTAAPLAGGQSNSARASIHAQQGRNAQVQARSNAGTNGQAGDKWLALNKYRNDNR